MECFTLTGASGWQTLSSLLEANATFVGKYLWTMFSIKNTHATNTIVVKSLPGVTAPGTSEGMNLGVGEGFAWDAGNQGIIDGRAIWIRCSDAATTFDVSFIRKAGI